MGKTARDWLKSLAVAFVTLFFLFLLCWPYEITGESMAGALLPGDRIVVCRLAARLAGPTRGDLVVYSVLIDGKKETVVKRIVALPGDHVRLSGGKLYLNGAECEEPYLGNTTTIGQTDIILDEDEYFALGDNRAVSFDSRAHGPVRRGQIIGIALARWYPFNNFYIFLTFSLTNVFYL